MRNKETAFKAFMDKMIAAERSVKENGCYSEEEVEKKLDELYDMAEEEVKNSQQD